MAWLPDNSASDPKTPSPISKSAGFTLIELIMVIVVIGLLATSAVDRNPTGVDRVAKARRLASDIRLTQSYAMSRGVDFRILSTGLDSYEIRDAGGDLFQGNQTSLSGVSLSSFDILFGQLGEPTGGAETITLTSASGDTTVQVLADTGYVEVP